MGSDRSTFVRFAFGCALAALLVSGCGKSAPSRLLVIGLDGATWEVIEPWIEAGELPNLKALRDQSAWGTMNSVIPYLSPPAWTSAVTGVNPGRHNIFDFQRKLAADGGTIKVVTETAHSRKVEPIWNALKGRGPEVCIINVPMTDPPDEVDGLMISGMPHVDEVNYTYPPELQDRIEAAGYLIDRMEMKLPAGEEEEIFRTQLETLRERGELVKELYTEQEWDLFWVVFTQTDRVQHTFWKLSDPDHPDYDAELSARMGNVIKKIWLEQDRILGEILALIPEDTWVMTLSDHGFGPIYREMRVLNRLHEDDSDLNPQEAEQVYSYERSDAARLLVRNIDDRDPGAVLTRSEAAEVETKIVSTLKRSMDEETGQRPVEAVYRNEEIFVGKWRENGPDVTILPARGYHVVRGDDSTGYSAPVYADIESSLSGWHRMNGIFSLRGPGVEPGKRDEVYSLLDVVPTCMYVLDQPMAEDLDGKVMEGCFASDFLERRKIRHEGFVEGEVRELTAEDEKALRNIPYMSGE